MIQIITKGSQVKPHVAINAPPNSSGRTVKAEVPTCLDSIKLLKQDLNGMTVKILSVNRETKLLSTLNERT